MKRCCLSCSIRVVLGWAVGSRGAAAEEEGWLMRGALFCSKGREWDVPIIYVGISTSPINLHNSKTRASSAAPCNDRHKSLPMHYTPPKGHDSGLSAQSLKLTYEGARTVRAG